MIPSHWFRQALLMLLMLETVLVATWWVDGLAIRESSRAQAQTAFGVVILLLVYAGAPLAARFLAPYPAKDQDLQARVNAAVQDLPKSHAVFLYEHPAESASAVGLMARHARVYLTTGLVSRLSDEALRGVLAHEATHIREHHILLSYLYACAYAFAAHFFYSPALTLIGFVGFLALRRYLEYRADAGAAQLVGVSGALVALQELALIYPTRFWSRWTMYGSPYPTLELRKHAVAGGRRVMF